MSKKLIAVAAAAALALTGLVAAPASASAITGVVIDAQSSVSASHASSDNAVTAATAMTSRTLDYSASNSTTRNVVRFVVTTSSASAVNVSATGAVKLSDALVDGSGTALTVTAGVGSLQGSTISSRLTYTFYAFNTSTTAGSVVITTPNSSLTFFVKGLAGEAYNITNVKWPSAIISGAADDSTNTNIVEWNTTDVFGNSIETAQGTLTAFSSTTPTVVAKNWIAANKVNRAVLTGASGSTVALSLSINPISLAANGWPAPVKNVFTTISSASLADRVTALTAQVAALTAQLANTVTKAKYNKLVRKWNRANPNNKVARVS